VNRAAAALAIAIAGGAAAVAVRAVAREVTVVATPAAVADAEEGKDRVETGLAPSRTARNSWFAPVPEGHGFAG